MSVVTWNEHFFFSLNNKSLNDLKKAILHSYSGLPRLKECLLNASHCPGIEYLVELGILLYADDTIILSESAEELQKAINAMHA